MYLGDGVEGLPGVWQAGGGAGSGGGVSTNEGRRGKKVDEDAKKRNQVGWVGFGSGQSLGVEVRTLW